MSLLVTANLVVSCNEKIDGSSESAYKASLERMAKGKSEEENKELLRDMVVIAFYYEDATEMRKAVHGKDRQQLKEFAEHIRELTRMKKEALAKQREEERENEKRRIEENQRQERLKCEEQLKKGTSLHLNLFIYLETLETTAFRFSLRFRGDDET